MSEIAEFDRENEGFKCTDDSTAMWIVKKLQELDADTKAWKQFYAAQSRKVAEQNERSAEYFRTKLHEYFDTLPHRRTRSGWLVYDLPLGNQLVLKPATTEFEHDDDKLLTWAMDNNPELVRVKTSFDWSAMKKCLVVKDGEIFDKHTGELVEIDGLKTSEVDPKFVLVRGED